MVGKTHVAAVINNAMLEAILAEIRPLMAAVSGGYIPALASVSGDKLALRSSAVDGQHFAAGDAHERFPSILSPGIEPVVAMNHYQEEEIWRRVGVSLRPTLDPFAARDRAGQTAKPVYRTGAGGLRHACRPAQRPASAMLEIVRRLSGVADIAHDPVVARSEFDAFGAQRRHRPADEIPSVTSDNDVATVLQNCFHYCSLEMSCVELARTFLFSPIAVSPRTWRHRLSRPFGPVR